jgi:hypothetical protein
MSIAYVYHRRTFLAAGALSFLFSVSLGGCATSTAGSSLMDARAEALPPKTSAYLPVEDLPPPREMSVMTQDERSKLRKELIAARDRQAAAAKAQGTEPSKPN